jgi:hypothetical protein
LRRLSLTADFRHHARKKANGLTEGAKQMADRNKAPKEEVKPAAQPSDSQQEKPLPQEPPVFKKDMELRRRIKEQHPTLTDEELERHLAAWGE